MRRRDFITFLGGAAVTWPLTVRAQQGERMRRIGVLMGFNENDLDAKVWLSGFTRELQELGWTDGRNVRMDVRWAAGNVDRMRMLAKELVDLQPDVILSSTTSVTAALQRQTRTIPIAFVVVGDAGKLGEDRAQRLLFVVGETKPNVPSRCSAARQRHGLSGTKQNPDRLMSRFSTRPAFCKADLHRRCDDASANRGANPRPGDVQLGHRQQEPRNWACCTNWCPALRLSSATRCLPTPSASPCSPWKGSWKAAKSVRDLAAAPVKLKIF